MFRNVSFGLVLLVAAFGSSSKRSLDGIEFHAGVYNLPRTNGESAPAVYSNPHVAGIALRTLWSTLEPVEGQYDWSYLDSQIALAAQNNKKVSISIGAGGLGGIQDWLVAAGVQTFGFYDRNPNHPNYCAPGNEPNCTPVTMVVPWDPIFLDKWTRFIRAFGKRYRDNPTISYVRGASESVTNGWGLPDTDIDGKDWFAYGYTSERLLEAMKQVLDAFMEAFPTLAVWVEVGTIRFDRAPKSPHSPTWVAEQIAEYGFATYPQRMGVWREDIYACTPTPPTSGHWLILWQHQGQNGAQMLQAVVNTRRVQQGDPTRCLTDESPASILRASIDVALAYRMPYLEIYQADLLTPELAPAIQYAAENIRK